MPTGRNLGPCYYGSASFANAQTVCNQVIAITDCFVRHTAVAPSAQVAKTFDRRQIYVTFGTVSPFDDKRWGNHMHKTIDPSWSEIFVLLNHDWHNTLIHEYMHMVGADLFFQSDPGHLDTYGGKSFLDEADRITLLCIELLQEETP